MTQVLSMPVPPGKLDIIPIHASDRGQFKRCRRRWDWSSPMRSNLVPKAEESGIVFPLWYGNGVHWALKHYYDPSLQRDPVETFKTWYQLQMYGGDITEDWMEITYDRHPKPIGDWMVPNDEKPGINGTVEKMYTVRGLFDILPFVEEEEFESHRELGIGMLTFYKEYAAAHDNFDVIAAEHTFSIPIYDPDTDSELYRVDPRDGIKKPVHLRGTQDAIIQDRETGKFGILEHKTAAVVNEDYFAKLDKDEQCTTYMFAGEVEATLHDMPYKDIEFVLYNALRKAYPKPPTITTRGNISIDRQKESTTIEMLMATINDLGLDDSWEQDEKLSNYVAYVQEQGEKQFIQRDMVYRNRHERLSCGRRVYYEVMDMLDPKLALYPNPTGDYMCLRCPFRAPCIAKDDGSDYEMMLDDMYERNWTR